MKFADIEAAAAADIVAAAAAADIEAVEWSIDPEAKAKLVLEVEGLRSAGRDSEVVGEWLASEQRLEEGKKLEERSAAVLEWSPEDKFEVDQLVEVELTWKKDKDEQHKNYSEKVTFEFTEKYTIEKKKEFFLIAENYEISTTKIILKFTTDWLEVPKQRLQLGLSGPDTASLELKAYSEPKCVEEIRTCKKCSQKLSNILLK